MSPDLQGLAISPGELRHLSGIDPADVFQPALLRDRKFRFHFIVQEAIIALALTPLMVGFIYTFAIRPALGASIPAAIACAIIVPIATLALRHWWRQHSNPAAFVALLEEVNRYNAVIKAMELGDRLESANAPNSLPKRDRKTILSALQLTRDDLVRALRAERILRENRDFLATNPDLFANNLTALQALHVSQQASEYGQILDEAVQIGIGIQAEMRKLQRQNSNLT